MDLLFIVLVLVLLGAAYWVIFSTGSSATRLFALTKTDAQAKEVLARLESDLSAIENLGRSLSIIWTKSGGNTQQFSAMAQALMDSQHLNDWLFDAGIFLLPASESASFRPEWMAVYTPTGWDISPQTPSETDYTKTEWFASARYASFGHTHWSMARPHGLGGTQAFTCSTPIFDHENQFTGAVALSIPVSALDTFAKKTAIEGQSLITFTSRDNNFLALPEAIRQALPQVEQPQEQAEAYKSSFTDVGSAFPQMHPLVRALDANRDRMYRRIRWELLQHQALVDMLKETELGGDANAPDIALAVGVFADIQERDPIHQSTIWSGEWEDDPTFGSTVLCSLLHVPKTYWRLIYIQPEKQAIGALISAARKKMAVISLLLIAAPIGVLMLLRRDLIGPVRHLSSYLMILKESEGDFLQGLGEKAPNELLELAYALNQRTNALRAANNQLRKEIDVREKAEQALRRSESRFRNVLENTRDMLYELNLDSKTYEYISPASYQITGFTSEELNRMGSSHISERIHPDDYPAVRSHFKGLVDASIANNLSAQIEYRWKSKNGSYLWVSENRTLVRDKGGKPAALVASARDVTERKRREEEVRRMRRYLRNIIDSMPSVIIGVDKEGNITHWNQEAARISAISAEEAQGRLFDECFSILKERSDEVRAAIASGAPLVNQRLFGESPEGETRFYDLIVYPLVADEVEGAVIRIDDVSARVQIEEMMVQTEKMMSVGGLAAGMAHEINNPLGGILQACQNIERRTSLDLPKNRLIAEELGADIVIIRSYMEKRGILDFISGIRADGTRAAKIVADMLAFSRRSESHFAPANLPELVDTVLRLAVNDYDLKKHYDFRRITINRVFDEPLPEVRCDKTKVEQVLLNLIKNAAQAMAINPNQKDPTLTIEIEKEKDHVRIEVADNGPGMEEKIRKRVFEPFFTTKEVGVGTGLGLSVSYFIITKQHRGSMKVESAPGQGTRFIIRLPINVES